MHFDSLTVSTRRRDWRWLWLRDRWDVVVLRNVHLDDFWVHGDGSVTFTVCGDLAAAIASR